MIYSVTMHTKQSSVHCGTESQRSISNHVNSVTVTLRGLKTQRGASYFQSLLNMYAYGFIRHFPLSPSILTEQKQRPSEQINLLQCKLRCMNTSSSEFTASDAWSHRAIWSRSKKDDGKAMKAHFHLKFIEFQSLIFFPGICKHFLIVFICSMLWS